MSELGERIYHVEESVVGGHICFEIVDDSPMSAEIFVASVAVGRPWTAWRLQRVRRRLARRAERMTRRALAAKSYLEAP